MSQPSEMSGLQVSLVRLLESSMMHLDQAQKDTERLRARLANVPYEIIDDDRQHLLEETRALLFQVERKLVQAKAQVDLQRKRAARRDHGKT